MENLSITAKAAGPSKTLGQYGTPSTLVAKNLIIYPDVKGIKYEIDLELLTMMQENAFSGEEHEDPNSHLTKVNDICEVVWPRSLPKYFLLLKLFCCTRHSNVCKPYQEILLLAEKTALKNS
jgi:hypothetical protein